MNPIIADQSSIFFENDQARPQRTKTVEMVFKNVGGTSHYWTQFTSLLF